MTVTIPAPPAATRRWFLGASGAVAVLATKRLEAASLPGRLRLNRLSLHNLNTQERLDVEFRQGRDYDRRALRALNYLLRDWRQGEVLAIDPRLFDMMAELAARVGQPPRFEIVSGYRSPQTNAMLRRNGVGAAKHSLHMVGQAIDLRLKGTKLSALRQAAIDSQAGGVGYYARSRFVHIDTGDVRSWSG